LKGLDTNVIVRFLVRDDERQWQIANQYIEQMKIGNADFSDYLITRINQLSGCHETASFDVKLGQSEGVKLLD
jgi:predicted nucleic-acid-binding protein